jgi:hypothetical protein
MGKCRPVSDGVTGAAIVGVLEAAHESLGLGGAVVEIASEPRFESS